MKKGDVVDPPTILFMGTYPPRECGIATFTRDLMDSIDKRFSPIIETKVLAINDNDNIYNYSPKVMFRISDNDIADYIDTAKKINSAPEIKFVSIQHEFGIFGGEFGDNLLAFLELLEKPTIVTFHSVLPRPDERMVKVVREIAERVHGIIVMTKSGVSILQKRYGVTTPISVIPHGIPHISFEPQLKQKTVLGYEDKIILSSFGLMSPNKGYEYVIDALPEVVRNFPNLVYFIVGETHPRVREEDGEVYRNWLKKKAKSVGVQKNVKFYNKYITQDEIIQYLKATDIYISPSLTRGQITSGTLVNAMGCGRAVVSTRFLHAKDIINPKRGRLVKFKKPVEFSVAISELLSDKEKLKNIEKNAYQYTRQMTWENVAISYGKLFNEIINIPNHYLENLPEKEVIPIQALSPKISLDIQNA
jgi:glycosyltransferase involved in cell wall biosynthesis